MTLEPPVNLPGERVAVESPQVGPSRPLKVCAVAYAFYESDARVMRYNKALSARGDMVDVITLGSPDRPRVSSSGGVTIFSVQTRKVNERGPLSYLIRILCFFIRTMVLLSWRELKVRYDVVHVHSVPEFLVFAAWLPKLRGARIILDIHDLLPELYASKFKTSQGSLLFKALLLIERTSARFADHVIAANDLWLNKLVNRSVSADRATALLNFPDRSVFRPGRTRADGKFVMIYPGTLNRHQGLEIAIEAFARIKPGVPEAAFHIYGVGPAKRELEKLVEQLGLRESILLRDPLPLNQIARVMAEADLGIVPKRKDSFGNEAFSTKILEFMAVGVPVIVSDTKIDTHYFSDGLVKFFRSGSVDDLAGCMMELIANAIARQALVNKGLQFVQTNSWDMKQTVYLKLVDSLVRIPAGDEPERR